MDLQFQNINQLVRNFVFVVAVIFSVSVVNAKEVPVQARVFIGVTSVDPVDVNTELAAQSLKELDASAQFGAEILYPLAKFLDVGVRYSKRGNVREEATNGGATPYQAELEQDSYQGVVRIPFFSTAILRADAFAAFGGTNTTLSIKSASLDGSLEKKDNASWFADTMSSYGASVAVGYKKVYFVVEAGFENNEVDKFKRVGNIGTNIDTIDLSGSYVTIGVLYDGAQVTRR